MKKIILIILLLAGSLALFFVLGGFGLSEQENDFQKQTPGIDKNSSQKNTFSGDNDTKPENKPKTILTPPMENASERVTKKPFGILVSPENSPIPNERFTGYHSGTDFEILANEEDVAVKVKTICSGEILFKDFASGYGGVAVQSCQVGEDPITVIYGHLDLKSIDYQVGEEVKEGDVLGILGEGQTRETDGERKHLHLGLHKGETIDIRGYVQSKTELSNWFDPCDYICQ